MGTDGAVDVPAARGPNTLVQSRRGEAPPHRRVVVDLEATCWSADVDPALAADQRNEAEIIEFGAVMDGREPFRVVVRPRRHPIVSAFCTALTGLTQADLDAAPPFPDAYRAFLDWAGGDEGLILASWGAFDDRQLRRDAQRHGLPGPRWDVLNIKRAFASHAKRHGAPKGGWMGLGQALVWTGLGFDGTPHRALDDARNAARVLAWLEEHARTPC